jgi:hypothetical protein
MFSIIEERWISHGGREQDRPAILKEKLSLEDWKVVSVVQKILQPFKVASKQLQGAGIPCQRSTSGGRILTELAPREEKMDDELDRWLRLADPVEKDCDPFLYWFNKRFEYPRLTRMAIDILSVPPMAAECERVFSFAEIWYRRSAVVCRQKQSR